MKYKTTQKAIKEKFRYIIYTGYAELQSLLKHVEPIAYTAGVYGWNADIYTIDGVAIVTGYRPFGNIRADYDICEKYESEANHIIKSVYNYEECKTALDDLISKFIEEVAK